MHGDRRAGERSRMPAPEGHIRDAIACYPRDAIAIFSGKRTAGTIPDGVDARYLLGIVRNLHHRHESEPITET